MELRFESIEQKWQKRWYEKKIYEAKKEKGKKFFIHFAYPGISGFLHVGHMRGFTYSDIIARYMRMSGRDVIFPAGFHATGLPAVSLAKKVARGDEAMLSYLRTNGCPEDVIARLSDPVEVVRYFSRVYVEDYWKKFGFLIDYSRLMDTISPGYQKFIQWQFRRLNEHGLLVQKPHFAPYCPNCGPVAVDKSETDISEGGDAEILEFVILKFTYDGKILPAATLRPETVFGVTNMWVNEDVEYVIARVGEEEWIVSREAAEKLGYQMDDVEVVGIIRGKELVGKTCTAPLIGREVPILPAPFASPSIATGIVMSVPAHAPYDYIALRDIGMPVEPVVIINVEGYRIPAQEIVEQMHIQNQGEEEKLEEATQIIYKDEFHKGVMNERCGSYAGMRVNDAKDAVREELFAHGLGALMQEFSKKVVCRCGTEVVIKRIPDQWFIKYSDEELTERSKEWARHMNIYPGDYYDELPRILEWFTDRACIRQGSWLGTPFPFDEEWIIEPISDSTLYPAYYLIAKYVNEGHISPEDMTDAFFDYVFLGKGEPENELWERVREDVSYWYPVDINLGGKEHKTVHFPVFIMNHVAIMPEEFFPRGIFVNWWITQKTGAKISKSKGGAEPIPDAARRYGVDALRLYYAHIGSPFVDIEWDSEAVEQYKRRLVRIWGLFEELAALSGTESNVDAWLMSAFNEKMRIAREAMEAFELRKAANALFFDCYSVFSWYMKRGGKNSSMVQELLEKWVCALTPFTPHMAEEMWEVMGKEGFVSLEDYPEYGEIDKAVLKSEEILIKTMEDIEEIKKVAKIEPKTIHIYVAPRWKWEIAERAMGLKQQGELDMKRLMEEVKTMGVDMRQASQFAAKLLQELRREDLITLDLKRYFEEAREFMEHELSAKIEIHDQEGCYDPAGKQKFAMPYKPALYME